MTKAFAILVALAACASELEPPDVPAGVLEINDGDMQGRHLLGDPIDDLGTDNFYFWVGGSATMVTHTGTTVYVLVSVDDGRLVARSLANTVYTDPRDYLGMVFNTGTAPLRIKHVQILGSGDYRYELEYRTGGSYTPYCNAAIDVHALAMQGRWNKVGRVHEAGSEISFGCVDSGVSAKCFKWGYRPGATPSSDAWQYHQTCTQMANANYCLNGPHTRELTPIDMRDYWTGGTKDDPELPSAPLKKLDPAVTWPPVDGEYYYEAAWKPNGDVMCLTRFRWASLSAGGYCPVDVPDPRESGSHGQFCEDLNFGELATKGALLFDATPMMDMFLYTWSTPHGERVTTVTGYVEGTKLIEPFSGNSYGNPTPDAILLRTLTGTLHENVDVIPVYQQVGPGPGSDRDRVIAPLNTVPAHVVGDREGYLFTTPGPGRVEFWLGNKGNDYLSAMTLPTDYQPGARLLGYAIAP